LAFSVLPDQDDGICFGGSFLGTSFDFVEGFKELHLLDALREKVADFLGPVGWVLFNFFFEFAGYANAERLRHVYN